MRGRGPQTGQDGRHGAGPGRQGLQTTRPERSGIWGRQKGSVSTETEMGDLRRV